MTNAPMRRYCAERLAHLAGSREKEGASIAPPSSPLGLGAIEATDLASDIEGGKSSMRRQCAEWKPQIDPPAVDPNARDRWRPNSADQRRQAVRDLHAQGLRPRDVAVCLRVDLGEVIAALREAA
ncbi:MAG: hypothetical protein IT483_15760 [Gammaproteobacteria bacterium]|nr:hypothetical protein [Gammaproteobacteria bacterium]